MIELPKLLTTSVVRGSEKGQSHGGVYVIDFNQQTVDKKIDWNTTNIDFAGRGWDRGLRGIEFTDNAIWIAASDELFCYAPDFSFIESYRNPYLRHCHEICRRDQLLFLTSTGFDSILSFDLSSKSFVWGLYLSKNGTQWIGQAFDPLDSAGPKSTNSYHLNMVSVDEDGVYFSGLNTEALLALSADLTVTEFCSLPRGCHNAQPFGGGVLFNDTGSDVVRFVPRHSREKTVPVPKFKTAELLYHGVDDSRIARQGFGRGMCIIDDRYVAAGSSPSTVSIIDFQKGERVTAVNLTMDIRNAIHGLEIWPNQWA